jgi:hypothetical protein
VTDEVPPDVAERRYERWVMRAAELVWGDYPDDRKGAERVLLARMQKGLVGSVPPRDFLGEGESTLEEVSEYFSDDGETTCGPHARSSPPCTRWRAAKSGRWSSRRKRVEKKWP